MSEINTTRSGYVNRNGQVVIRNIGLPGTDHGQSVYQLGCSGCGHAYGANASDIHLRLCPKCQGGAAGLPLTGYSPGAGTTGFPRRIILSRKGFDQSSGKCPSLILQDGTILSIPIPEDDSHSVRTTFALLGHQRGQKLPARIVTSPGCEIPLKGSVHLDPDIRPELRPAFAESGHESALLYGQDGGFQTHLATEGVQSGDLFLFFGLFRRGRILGDAAYFDRAAKKEHVLWGWLQVGEVHHVGRSLVPSHLASWRHHPHLDDANRENNCLYSARRALSFIDRIPGAGVFESYHSDLRLTIQGEHRPSFWSLPEFFGRAGMTFHQLHSWYRRGDRIEGMSVGRGQEFVSKIECVQSEAHAWLCSLFAHAKRAN